MNPLPRQLAQSPYAINRRAFLTGSTGMLGGLALSQLLPAQGRSAPSSGVASSRPTATSVIGLFQNGGPSQMDLFDPKPLLTRLHGKPHDGDLETHFHKQKGNLLASPFRFHRHGDCGMELSESLPQLGSIADQITLVRSMRTDSVDHEQALRAIHSGKILPGRPVLGAWVVYALGTENENLPSYVVLADRRGLPIDGARNWSSGWLPASYQGTGVRSGPSPVFNLKTPDGVTPAMRRGQLDFLGELNRAHHNRHASVTELEARIEQFELAARMQVAVPDALDVDSESAETKALYGLDNEATADYGRRLIMARRLVERGVRFVQVYLNGQPWDTHNKNAASLRGLCAMSDQPSAALVKDLAQRGLLENTIVMWFGEFGRLPISQGKDGRDHNRHGFSLWLAGGGFKRGYVHGATDDIGYRAVDGVVTVHDLNATLLHALGLDHAGLTYPHSGRDESLTDPLVSGARVQRALLA